RRLGQIGHGDNLGAGRYAAGDPREDQAGWLYDRPGIRAGRQHVQDDRNRLWRINGARRGDGYLSVVVAGRKTGGIAPPPDGGGIRQGGVTRSARRYRREPPRITRKY